jgi:hypothetical protein
MQFSLRSALGVLAACAGAASAGTFTAGNLVVSQIGLDGSSTALSSAAAAVRLKEFTLVPNAAFVNTVDLPTAVNGLNHRLTDTGTGTSDGMLTLSTDGRYLTIQGYDANVATASVVSTTSANTNRVVALVDFAGNVDTTTALSDAYSGNNFRASAFDGTTLYTAGTGSPASSAGVRTATVGGIASTAISGSLTNTRVVNLFGGGVYVSSSSGSNLGVSLVSGGAATLLPGFTSALAPSSYDFFFANSSTLYVADDSANANGGVQKWVFDTVASTWSRAGVIGTGVANIGARGLTGAVDAAGNVSLYAITAEASANRLIAIADTLAGNGSGATVTTLQSAPTNTIFRGVDFAPVPAPGSLALLGLGSLAAFRRRR